MVRSLKWASILSFSFVRQSYQRHFFRKFIQGYVPLANFKFLWYNSYGVLRQTSTLYLLFLSFFTGQGFLLEKIFLIFQILQTFLGNLPVWVNFWKIKSWFKHVNDNQHLAYHIWTGQYQTDLCPLKDRNPSFSRFSGDRLAVQLFIFSSIFPVMIDRTWLTAKFFFGSRSTQKGTCQLLT